MTDRLRLGVSDCLMGRLVRHDGGHKHDRYLTETLGQWVEWVPVCPEVEIGLGTPRAPMRLIASGTGPRLVVRATGQDLTARLEDWSAQWTAGAGDLEGFVLKKDSPSCGMERVRLYPATESDGGSATRDGVGIFARVLAERMPHLPVEEEGRLNDPALREHFFGRVFAHRRWRRFRETDPGLSELMSFHADAKMSLLSHHERRYRELGRIVAGASKRTVAPAIDAYEATYFDIYRHRATRRRHTNVLQHLAGHVKRGVDDSDRSELTSVIQRYRAGTLPLIVPITLLRHHARRVGSEWLRSQTYLDPYPDELMLRNHV
jgi:uncharacterized protein YbgA (DUF1722 family)/uncharacterized protein YbbK (DUF523 family)